MSLPIANLAMAGINLYLAKRAHDKLKAADTPSDKALYTFCRGMGIAGGVIGVTGALISMTLVNKSE